MRALALALLLGWGAALGFTGDIEVKALPAEARQTLALIRSGGPYPYARDGVVFNNREAQLPRQPRGYYREYTVQTPAARDRGARRIIVGRGGELYYTEDHYRTFRRIIE
jgi:ribonuclease T1